MAKQLNVDLNFRANTTQAQQQIQQLQASLTQIAAAGTVGIGGEKITAEIKQASAAAKELQMHLSKAMNTQTGTLDLNRLNNSLTGAKTNLQALSSSLLQIGPTGTTAFTQLATAVSQADRPMLALNGELTQLWTVMKNTAKWQLSSSMIHGFIGGISQAYRYAQDLNESLNNIRIVTGYSSERMEEFAIQANKAAKSLSTTTNEYAKASLIYFQQGLSDQQVKDRTDITIKMANVSRQSAEVVSDQMTAVWNNFYDGSKSLEHYADVMVKLGAETASSSDEIAGGLEKFAAIGETVGLSFEYAASALATITAETRQSEEVVGTSLKTIFARIQGLNMGETLEDGTDFNKYSETLAAIGVNIKDQNGQLKDMDNILDELGAKWGTLARDQQMAVAQNVAGLRQYNQFISLMSNWDVMQENLERSNNASGALNKQAETYADSWEAARNNVTASAEAIYDALLNDKFFISLSNMFSGLLDSVSGFIDEIGGLKTIMIGAFGLLASYLGNKIQPMINNLRANFQILFTGASQQAINLGNSMQQAIEKAKGATGKNLGFGERQQLDNAQALIIAKNKLSAVNKSLNSEERFLAETELQLIQMEQDKALALAKTREQLEKNIAATKEQIAASNQEVSNKMMSGLDSRWASAERGQATASLRGDTEAVAEYSARLEGLNNIYWQVDEAVTKTSQNITNAFINSLQQSNDQLTQGSQLFAPYIDGLRQLESVQQLSNQSHGHPVTLAKEQVEAYIATLPQAVRQTEAVTQAINNVRQATSGKALKAGVEELAKALEQAGFSAEKIETIMMQVGQGSKIKGLKADIKDLDKTIKELTASEARLKQAFANFNPTHNFTGVERITAMGSALSSTAMAAMSLKTIFTSWSNEDMSFGEKLTSSLMAIGMLIPSVSGAFRGLLTVMGLTNIQSLATATILSAEATTRDILNGKITAETLAKQTGMALDQAEVIIRATKIAAIDGEQVARTRESAAIMASIVAKKLGMSVEQQEQLSKLLSTGLTLKQALAEMGLTGVKLKGIPATIAATLVNHGWNASLAAVVGIVAVLTLALGGLALIVWGVTAAVKAIIEAHNAEKIAVENATAALEQSTEAYNRANEAAQSLKKTIEDYENAIKTLEDLQEGTEEYSKALQEANQKAKDLIETHELYGKYKYNTQGLIEFDKGVLEGIQNKADAEVREAQRQQTYNKVNLEEKKLDETIHNKKIEIQFGASEQNQDQSKTYTHILTDEDKQAIVNAFVSSGKDIKTMTNAEISSFVDSIKGLNFAVYNSSMTIGEQREAFIELIDETNQASDRIANFLKEETENRYKSEYAEEIAYATGGNEGLTDMVAAGLANAMPNLLDGMGVKETKEDYVKNNKWFDTSKITSNSELKNLGKAEGDQRFSWIGNDANVAQAYAHYVLGYDWDEVKRMGYKGGNGTGSMTLDGEELFTNLSDKTMRQALAEDWMNDYLDKQWENKYGGTEQAAVDQYTETVGELSGTDIGNILLQQSASGKTSWQDALDLTSLTDLKYDYDDLEQFYYGDGEENNNNLLSYFGITKEQLETMGYENAGAFVSAFKSGFEDLGGEEAFYQRQADDIMAKGVETYDLDADVVEAQAKQIEKALLSTNKELKNAKVIAAEMTIANQRLNKGVNKLTDNWKDWNKTLRSSDKTTQDYAEAVVGVQDAMRDMFGLTEDAVIPEDFLQDTENLDLLDQVAQGSEEAAQKLHFNLTKAQIEAEEFSTNIAQNMINAFDFGDDVDLEATFNEMKTQALNALSEIQGMANGVDIGAGLKDPAKQAEMAAKLNEYAMAAGWTAEQMQSALASVGVRAKITMVEGNPVTKQIPITKITRSYPEETPITLSDGSQVSAYSQIETSEIIDYKSIEEPTLVPQIEMEDPENPSGQTAPIFEKVDMGNITPSATSGGKKSGGGGGGGGGSKPKKTSEAKKDKTDIVDRYKEVNDKLSETQRLMDKNSTLADTLWGSDKIKKIQENTKALKLENQQLAEKIALQKEYLAEDRTKLENAAAEAGIKFDFDETRGGIITNYTTEMTKLHEQREAMLAGFGDEMDETEQETLEKLDEKIEAVTSAYETYEETLNEGFEFDQEKLENEIEQMENRFQEIELKLEVKIELNENDIADIEHQLERLGDNNVYASAERIALIEKNAASYRNIADIQMEAIKEAERLYAADKISREDYVARLQESKEALQDAEMSIRDGIQQIGEELSNTFDLVDEKLDQQFTKFDQMIELMDHYKNVVSLTEGEASYKEFNKILKASQEVLRDRIAADESEVAMWESRRKQLEADIATLPEDSPAKREAEEALQAIMEKEADAKSQLMADIEQLGEYAREIFENSIEQAMKDFEDEMFGRPLNSIIESIEMMNSRQEELLTTTNKIYETNKLIRSVEKDIEATTNNRAKQAYLEFQNKVKQKQEQNELTKFELDLLTAEYEMTKAQIALEEARDAKDTVRLTRDAEGNYGYVYTANEDKVADAEQALDDATNNYYNTALEGAQKYQDQIYQHIQEWEEKVKEVYLDQTLSEEEKNKKIEEINDTYNTLIKQDKELYYMAIGEMQNSAYNKQVDYDLRGIESAENWFTECDGFLSDLEDAQDEYDRNTKEVSDHTEENFGRMETSIRNTKIESEKLKNQIVNNLVPELDTTLKDSIDNATEAWWKYIEALQEVIRLTDETMKKNHDTQLKESYKDNYAAEIQERLMNGADYSDYDIQRLLEYRWEKMGGVDNTDYAALIAAGGTPEEIVLWEVLRRFKIEQTDWSASDVSYADEMRENKLDQDYSQLIIDYLTSSPYGRWSDSQVQKYLREREIKIKERNMQGQTMSNQELKEYIAQQLNKKPEELLTGGYTGSWGPEGRLAVLHEKELVLNKQDTENFLSATNILREISQMLDRDALIASLGAINLRAMTLNSPADQVLQQEVTIHADFPNVTDHNEIELAIDNLINAASQHAYRT